jgi:diguanylate cyclase (GGDEF)-like protein/PAS domain S-box-containing protein
VNCPRGLRSPPFVLSHLKKAMTNPLRNDNVRIQVDWSIDRFANYIPVLIWASRVDGMCNYFNKYWLEFVGRKMEQEVGVGWIDNVHPDDLERCLDNYQSAVQLRRNFTLEYRLKRRDGEYRWILDNGVVRYDDAGIFAGFIGTCSDVTEHYHAKEIIERQRDLLARIAITDELTNLFNRRYFIEHAEIEIQRHKRYGHPLHLMMVDVDNFKVINDTCGHDEGDEVLRSLATVFNNHVRSIDIVCRIGGDEFCIIVPETDTKGVTQIAERILGETGNIPVSQFGERKTTISIGISEFTNTTADVKDWLKQADLQLYKAKAQGKNKISFG